LGFEQAVQAKVHGVMFEYGYESWVRGLEVVHGGDKALYMPHAKRCEVRDSVFDRVWFNVGGSGYVGWEHSFDCLMENVTTFAMRHAPVLQWASSGNVIRRSIFHGSDAQWHAGWTNENLFEELVVESSQNDGAYGNGMWASPPEDRGHGPNGPRNVIYNCNITSSKAGLWMGGMNEAWLVLYNRFVVGRGPAVVAKTASFDHIIRDNVFVLLEPYPAAIYLGSADCTGVELIGNRFYGPVTRLIGGAIPPAVNRDNHIQKSGDINRPQPAVRSIYEWQQAHRDEIQAAQLRRAEKI
ncbi:MAG: endopolygalacturonase, partial [Opitutaceae bacterium]|nr:endopolygalacturonase [Opitutaceae bacterium]